MDWIQQWQSKLNKQNGVAPLVRTGGSRHTGLAALPYRNIQIAGAVCIDRVHLSVAIQPKFSDYSGARHTGLAAPPHRNIQKRSLRKKSRAIL